MIQGQKDTHKKYYKTWTFENGHANYPVDSFAKTENLMHIYGNGYIDKCLGTRIYKLIDDVYVLDMVDDSSGLFATFEGTLSVSTTPVIFCAANKYIKKKTIFTNTNFVNIPDGTADRCPANLNLATNGIYATGTYQMTVLETTITFTDVDLNTPSQFGAGTYRCVLFFTKDAVGAKPKICILEKVCYKVGSTDQDISGLLYELKNTGLNCWYSTKYRTTTIFMPYLSNSISLSVAEDCSRDSGLILPVGQRDEVLIGAMQYKETLYIFKENSIWSLYTDSFPPASTSLDYKIRCEVRKLDRILPHTIALSEEGIYFATISAIYLFDGTLNCISEKGDYNLFQDIFYNITLFDSHQYSGGKLYVGFYCYGTYDNYNKVYLFGYPTNSGRTTWKNIAYHKGKFYPLSFDINPSGMYYCQIDNFIWCCGSKATPIYKPYKIQYGYGFSGLEGTSNDTKISSSLLTPISDCDNPHILKRLTNIYINGYIPPANYADCSLAIYCYNREMIPASATAFFHTVYINSEGITVPIVGRNFVVQNFYYISCLLTMKQKVYIKSITVEYEKVGILS